MAFISPLASEWFLSKLLAYRRDFLYIGALLTSAKGALISWIDVILATIGETSVCISSNTSRVDSMEGTLAKHQEDEVIRAASQLPCRSNLGATYSSLIVLRYLGRNVGPCDVEHGVVFGASVGCATLVCRIYSTPSALRDEI
jgi:hypothetical protein